MSYLVKITRVYDGNSLTYGRYAIKGFKSDRDNRCDFFVDVNGNENRGFNPYYHHRCTWNIPDTHLKVLCPMDLADYALVMKKVIPLSTFIEKHGGKHVKAS